MHFSGRSLPPRTVGLNEIPLADIAEWRHIYVKNNLSAVSLMRRILAADVHPSALGYRPLSTSIPSPASGTDSSFSLGCFFPSLCVSGVAHLQSVPCIQKPSIFSSCSINASQQINTSQPNNTSQSINTSCPAYSSQPGPSWAQWASNSK